MKLKNLFMLMLSAFALTSVVSCEDPSVAGADDAEFSFTFDSKDPAEVIITVDATGVEKYGVAIVSKDDYSDAYVADLYSSLTLDNKGEQQLSFSADSEGNALEELAQYYAVAVGADGNGDMAYDFKKFFTSELNLPFDIIVDDGSVSSSSANVSILPAKDIIRYHSGVVKIDVVESDYDGDLTAFVEDYVVYLEEQGVDFGTVNNGYVFSGDSNTTVNGLAELTPYYVYAVGINANAELTSDVVSAHFTTEKMPESGIQFYPIITGVCEDGAMLDVVALKTDGQSLDFENSFVSFYFAKSEFPEWFPGLDWDDFEEYKLEVAVELLPLLAQYPDNFSLNYGVGSFPMTYLPADEDCKAIIIGCDKDYSLNTKNVKLVDFHTLPEGTAVKELPSSYEFPVAPLWKGEFNFFDMNELSGGYFGFEVPVVETYPEEWDQPYVVTHMPKADYDSMTQSEVAAVYMEEIWDFCYNNSQGPQGECSFNVILAANMASGILGQHYLVDGTGEDLGEIKVIAFGFDNVTLKPTTAMYVQDFNTANPEYSELPSSVASKMESYRKRLGVPNFVEASIEGSKYAKNIIVERPRFDIPKFIGAKSLK